MCKLMSVHTWALHWRSGVRSPGVCDLLNNPLMPVRAPLMFNLMGVHCCHTMLHMPYVLNPVYSSPQDRGGAFGGQPRCILGCQAAVHHQTASLV